ncbi:MAG: hypothetical protein M5U12_19065 [Verrucomicrobia bacterium]|nr:hypothetical protein [Verrucomicrobiota bacterium]
MNVWAYIDPGSGLLIWQAVVAFFVGLVFYLKQTREWLFGLFRRLFRGKSHSDAAAKPGPLPPEPHGR